jgi:hypothetical protein
MNASRMRTIFDCMDLDSTLLQGELNVEQSHLGEQTFNGFDYTRNKPSKNYLEFVDSVSSFSISLVPIIGSNNATYSTDILS